MTQPFWRTDPGAPFATLIRVARTYCHPEADEDAYDDFRYVANREYDQEMQRFKAELRRAIADPSQLPDDELSRAVEYDDGSPEKFLRRLWHHLYGDEPVTAPARD